MMMETQHLHKICAGSDKARLDHALFVLCVCVCVLALLFRNTNIHIHRRWQRNELVTAPGRGILRESKVVVVKNTKDRRKLRTPCLGEISSHSHSEACDFFLLNEEPLCICKHKKMEAV